MMRDKLMQAAGTFRAGQSNSQPALVRRDYNAELTMFFALPTIDWTCDPIEWWKSNASRFPILASVARRFLSAPATSIASEQTFSVAKAVYDPRRAKMSGGKAEMLIFLNRNLPLLSYCY